MESHECQARREFLPKGACVFGTSLAGNFARRCQSLCICDHTSSHMLGHGPRDDSPHVHTTLPSCRQPYSLHLPTLTDFKVTQGEDTTLPVLQEPYTDSSPAPHLPLSKLQKPKGSVPALTSHIASSSDCLWESRLYVFHFSPLPISMTLLVASDRKHNSNWLKGDLLAQVTEKSQA